MSGNGKGYVACYTYISVAGCEMESQFLPKAYGLLMPEPSNHLLPAGIKVVIAP